MKIRILVEPIPGGFVATAFDDIGRIDSATATWADDAIERLQPKVERVIDDVDEYVIERL